MKRSRSVAATATAAASTRTREGLWKRSLGSMALPDGETREPSGGSEESGGAAGRAAPGSQASPNCCMSQVAFPRLEEVAMLASTGGAEPPVAIGMFVFESVPTL